MIWQGLKSWKVDGGEAMDGQEIQQKEPIASELITRSTIMADVRIHTIVVLVLVLGLAVIGGITGFRLLEGWV